MRIEDLVRESGDAELIEQVNVRREELHALEAQYDHFLEGLDVLGELSDEDPSSCALYACSANVS